MADCILLDENDSVAILRKQAAQGSDPLGLGAPLAASVPGDHKIARRAHSIGEEIIKFGQFIGHAT